MLITYQGTAFQTVENTEETGTEYTFTWGGRTVYGVQDSKKEEIHRYMGYELLLPKYISLLYDVGMNTNVRGVFIDISYLFVMFFPLILVLGIKNASLKLGVMLLALIFLVISNVTGYGSFHNIAFSEIRANLDSQIIVNSFSKAPLLNLKIGISSFFYSLYEPINTIFQIVSGEGDVITLPILLIIFSLTGFLLKNRLKETNLAIKATCFLMFLYCFFWWVLGAGIVWYGILMVAMGLVFITVNILKNKETTIDRKLPKYVFFLSTMIWILMATTFRLSNYEPTSLKESKMGAIHAASLVYGSGKMNEGKIMNLLFSGYKPALDQINANHSSLVYRAGTFMHYFIEKNNERVVEDNQLAFFDMLMSRVPDKIELANEFKRNGYEYLVMDLNIASIDLTPDKSLTKKATRFFEFVNDNPNIRLIATDRVANNGQVQKPGSFAVFKII